MTTRVQCPRCGRWMTANTGGWTCACGHWELSDAMLREFAPNDNIVGWMATELLALRAAGDALAAAADKTVPWVTLHQQQGFPTQPAREVTAREWNALEDAARAWRTARGDG